MTFSAHFPKFEALKKALHLFLLGFYMLSTTELRELAKLPVLFQHYFEHKGIDNKVTFVWYLEHHYNDIPHTDNDEERDNQLPFKTPNVNTANVNPALPATFAPVLKKTYQFIPIPKIVVNNDHFPFSAFSGKIWQPPKSIFLS